VNATTGVLAGLTLVVLIAQAVVFWRQLKVMAKQAEISERQLQLQREQADWRRTETIGTFYRTASDLAVEFTKANVSVLGVLIEADFAAHPREVLREASRVFAPLGDAALDNLYTVGVLLDRYYENVLDYNRIVPTGDLTRRMEASDRLDKDRAQIGRTLDAVHTSIPWAVRWKYWEDESHAFHRLCSRPQKDEPAAPVQPTL